MEQLAAAAAALDPTGAGVRGPLGRAAGRAARSPVSTGASTPSVRAARARRPREGGRVSRDGIGIGWRVAGGETRTGGDSSSRFGKGAGSCGDEVILVVTGRSALGSPVLAPT